MPRDERDYPRDRRDRPVEVDLDRDGDADVAMQALEAEGVSVADLRDILRNVERRDIIRLLAIVLNRRT